MTLSANFWSKASQSDCLVWHGAQNSKGYGCFTVDGTARLAHRLAWEDANGPIPSGMTIDHLCRNRSCVNVQHMEVVTRAENNKRQARSAGGLCKSGHSLDGPNALYVRRSGVSECRECRREQRRQTAA